MNTEYLSTVAPNKMDHQNKRKKKLLDNNEYHIDNISCSHLSGTILEHQHLDVDKFLKVYLKNYEQRLAVIIKKKQTHKELVQYLHVVCYSPVKST